MRWPPVLLLSIAVLTPCCEAKTVRGYLEASGFGDATPNIKYFERFVFAPSSAAGRNNQTDAHATGSIWIRTYTFMRDHTVIALNGDRWMADRLGSLTEDPARCTTRISQSDVHIHVMPSEMYGTWNAPVRHPIVLDEPTYIFMAVVLCPEAHDAYRAQNRIPEDVTTRFPHGGIFMYYELEFLNPGGPWRRHFSADEQGLLEAHLAMLIAFGVIALVPTIQLLMMILRSRQKCCAMDVEHVKMVQVGEALHQPWSNIEESGKVISVAARNVAPRPGGVVPTAAPYPSLPGATENESRGGMRPPVEAEGEEDEGGEGGRAPIDYDNVVDVIRYKQDEIWKHAVAMKSGAVLLVALLFMTEHGVYLLHFLSYAADGKGLPDVLPIAYGISCFAQVILTMFLLTSAKGWMVSQTQLKLRTRVLNHSITLALSGLYLALFLGQGYSYNPATMYTPLESNLVFAVIGVRAFCLLWLIKCIRRSLQLEKRKFAQRYFKTLLIVAALWFAAAPILTFAQRALPPHNRLLFYTATEAAATALALATLCASSLRKAEMSPRSMLYLVSGSL